jgi:hypothetical protein
MRLSQAEPVVAYRKDRPIPTFIRQIAGSSLLLCAGIGLASCAKEASTSAPPAPPEVTVDPVHVAHDPSLQAAWNLIYGYQLDSSGKAHQVDSTPEDFATAEALVKKVLEKNPDEPEAVVVYAHVNDGFYSRGFDTSEARYALAEKYSESALQLAPNNPESLSAMAEYVIQRATEKGGAAQLLHQAIAINGNEPRYYRLLFTGVLKGEQQLTVAEQAAAKFPKTYRSSTLALDLQPRLRLRLIRPSLFPRSELLCFWQKHMTPTHFMGTCRR